MSRHRQRARSDPRLAVEGPGTSNLPRGAVSAAGGASSPRGKAALFGAVFLLLLLVFSSIASSRLVGVALHDRLTRIIAWMAASVLALFGSTETSGQYLSFNGFGAFIEGACDGLQPTYIYICAVLAFPSGWRAKMWGLLMGIPAIYAINLLRILTIMVCGAVWPSLTEGLHVYGWQAAVIVLTMALWVFWVERFAGHGRQADV